MIGEDLLNIYSTFWLDTSRFLNDHLSRDGIVPFNWIPKRRDPILSLDPGLAPPDFDIPEMEFDNPQLEVDNQAPDNENTQSSTVDQGPML
jgi:hypothetical protein